MRPLVACASCASDGDAHPPGTAGCGPDGAWYCNGVLRWIGRAALGALIAFLGLVAVYRVLPPPVTPLMLRYAPTRGIAKDWVALDDVSPSLVRAVIAAEDARFFQHSGVDWDAIRDAREYNARHGDEPRRGGSTITMQCARNVFLWQGKSYVRKALEVAVAYVIERAWGKRRILEVYLNVIEWGPGVYGAQAAAQRYFGVPASALRPSQAALLASVLPNPVRWNPAAPTRWVLARSAVIARRAARVSLGALD
jgi:monofunctional biosynthetic peptidoglycan transglycosylase